MHCSKIRYNSDYSGDVTIRQLPPTGSLEAFVAAARAGSLRGASETLNLSVSALSRRIQTLEQHAGSALFTRRANEYRLNEEGKRLLAEIEAPFDALASAFEQRGSARRNGLVVGVPTSFATAWLIPRLDSFRKANPDIDLRIDTSGSPVEKLGESLDLIIFFAEEGAERVETEPLRPQGAFLVARPGLVDPLNGLRATLRTTPLLTHRYLPQLVRTWKEGVGLSSEFEPQVDTFDDGALLVAAVQSGLGLALVLEDMVAFSDAGSGLQRPFGEYVRTPYSYAIASKPALGTSAAIERFRAWLHEETRKESQVLPVPSAETI